MGDVSSKQCHAPLSKAIRSVCSQESTYIFRRHPRSITSSWPAFFEILPLKMFFVKTLRLVARPADSIFSIRIPQSVQLVVVRRRLWLRRAGSHDILRRAYMICFIRSPLREKTALCARVHTCCSRARGRARDVGSNFRRAVPAGFHPTRRGHLFLHRRRRRRRHRRI